MIDWRYTPNTTVITVEYPITPKMWMEYWITLVDGGQSNYWAEWLTFFVRDPSKKKGWREVCYNDGVRIGAVSNNGIYEQEWKVQIRLHPDDAGYVDSKAGKLVRRYQITPQSFATAATKDPELFGRFYNYYAHDIGNFDAVDAEVLLQLATFGSVVFG